MLPNGYHPERLGALTLVKWLTTAFSKKLHLPKKTESVGHGCPMGISQCHVIRTCPCMRKSQ